jgi:Zn-dependent peptidase ImmA (M78 family)
MSNFTPAQTATMLENAPIDLEIAKQLAADFGMSHRAIISKAVMLKLYKAKAKAAPAAAKLTKAELIEDIEERMRLPHGELEGLKNATMLALKKLLASTLTIGEVS